MRTRHAAMTLAALSTGLTAAVALHRRADRRLPAPAAAAAPTVPAPVLPVPDSDGVVLPFVRPVPSAPALSAPVQEQPAVPGRCGDSGGRTKAGTPCAAKATTAGRCHHHRVAA